MRSETAQAATTATGVELFRKANTWLSALEQALSRRDGSTRPADLIVTATGYLGQRELVAKLLGDDIAQRIGPVWGIDETRQEVHNMWKRTPQPGLWFLAGGLPQCRVYSKTLALQIQGGTGAALAAGGARSFRNHALSMR